MFKRRWIPPMLIVIARGKSDERVLLGCKTSGNGGEANPKIGPSHSYYTCGSSDCTYCSSVSVS